MLGGTHVEAEKVALRARERVLPARARARTLGELMVQPEEEALLAALGATLHPLALGHDLDALPAGGGRVLRRLLELDDLLPAILGEEDACICVQWIEQAAGAVCAYLRMDRRPPVS
jgi:hypothetical protein